MKGRTAYDAADIMFPSLLFWFALLIPGYAVGRWVDGEKTDCGLLGQIGWAYLWAFALLAPVSIICYVTGAPIAVFSIACVLAVIGGAVVIVKRGWWRELGRLMAGGFGVELVLLIAFLVFTSRTGGFLSGDAEIHVARIRYLLDHGFSNHSPFVNAPSFFAVYHTNLLHAMYTACVQITTVDYLTVWSASIVWAKLVVAGGCYYLAWCALGNRWAAYVPTIFLAATFDPTPYMNYPNKLAPLWLLPIMLGAALRACREPVPRSAPAGIAGGSWVIAQVHGLYATFAGMAIAPLLGVWLVVRLVRRTGERKRLAWCLAGLVVGAPFVLVARYGGERPVHEKKADAAQTVQVKALEDQFDEYDDGSVALDFENFLGGQGGYRLAVMAVGLVAIALLGRWREAVGLAAMSAVVLAVLFIPFVCTFFVDLFGDRWVVLRMNPIVSLAIAVAACGAPALLVTWLHPKSQLRPAMWGVPALCAVAVALALWLGWDKKNNGWKDHLANVAKTAEERGAWLAHVHAQQAFYRENVPVGSVVLAHPRDGRAMIMLHDCYIVMPDRAGGVGLTLPERRADINVMIAADTPWEERKALLNKYDIHQLLASLRLRDALVWAEKHGIRARRGPETIIVDLNLD